MHVVATLWSVYLVVVSAAGASGGKVGLLASFEPAQLAKWGCKAKEDGSYVLGRGILARRGEATEGRWALVRVLTKRNLDWGGLRTGKAEEWLRYYHGTVFNATGRFAKWFPADWSGYQRLRMDVKSASSALKLRVQLEDV